MAFIRCGASEIKGVLPRTGDYIRADSTNWSNLLTGANSNSLTIPSADYLYVSNIEEATSIVTSGNSANIQVSADGVTFTTLPISTTPADCTPYKVAFLKMGASTVTIS